MRGQVIGCVAYTANYPCVYVVNSSPDTVSVINSTTNTVIVPAVAVGGTPMGAAITPDNRSVYVVNNDDGTVSIIDTTTNTVPTQAVLLASNGAALGSPMQVAITPDGTAAYVVGLGSSGFVAIIDTATQKLDLAITTGLSSPVSIAFSPDGKFAYITDTCPNEPSATACVNVLDTSTHLLNQAPGTPILIPGSVPNYSEAIAVTADGGLISVPVDDLYNNLGIAFISVVYNPVTNTNNYTYVTTLSLDVTSTTSDYGIAITPNGTLYAAEPALNSVAVVDTKTQTLTNTIAVGNSPTGVAATPDGAQVYVSNGFAGSVSVIDTQTQKVTSTLAVQTSPAGVAVMPTIVPTIQTQPASQTITYLQTASLSVEASGSPKLSYQWYQLSGSTPVAIAGATSSSFTTPALASTTTYLVSVSNLAASIPSDAATITVVPPAVPVINTQPTSQNINPSQTATLTVAAAGSPPLSFQWYQGQSGVTTTPVGTNSNSFTTPSLLATTAYWVRVTNSVASVDSNTVIVGVNQTPACSLSLQGAGSSESLFNNNQFKINGNANCTDAQGSSLTTTLDWGDGSPPSSQTGGSFLLPHVYGSSLPNYPVTVSSTDSLGLQGSAFYNLLLIPTSQQPHAVFAGQSTVVTISITGPQGLEVTFSCPTVTDSVGNVEQASDVGIECSSDPSIITFTGAPQTVTIDIQTTGPALARLFPAARPHSWLDASWFSPPWMVLLLLVILGAGTVRRPRPFRRARLAFALLPVAIGLLASCGGGFSLPKARAQTRPGSYQLTIVDEPVGSAPGFVQTSLIVPLTIAPYQ